MGDILMCSEVFAEKFEALLGVEEFLNAPDADFVDSSIFPHLIFQLR